MLNNLKLEEIPETYRAALTGNVDVLPFEKPLAAEPPLALVSSSFEEVTLYFLIDPSTYRIAKASFTGAVSDLSQKLLARLCTEIVDRPVNETHDHAVVRLEFYLRDKTFPRPKTGITLPFNSWKVFGDLTDLVRSGLLDYKKKAGFTDTKNFFVRKTGDFWRGQSKENRMTLVTQHVGNFCKSKGIAPDSIRLLDILKETKVVLHLDRPLEARGALFLMELENYLKERIEPALCLYREEKDDLNYLRWDEERKKTHKEALP